MPPERTKNKKADPWYSRLLWWRRSRVTEETVGNLPLQLTSLVGRQREIENVVAAFDDTRLVTLTGAGGVGKTRIALQAAAAALPRFRDGAWLCELAPMTNPDAVIEFVASSLGVRARPGQPIVDTLLAYLRNKQLLLIVDNCEHLLAPVARLVDMVGRSCPEVVVLATSREGLGITGERIFVVQPFALPEPDVDVDLLVEYDGARLFAERAAETKEGFEITAENAAAITHLCRHLDGLPLAIELAAARVRSLTPTELGARLDERFRLLTGGSRTALLRHRTLRGTLDWSYELLTEPQRHTLERLAVFKAGFGLDAAEAVVGNGDIDRGGVDDLLGSLVDKSLVVAEGDGPKTRYRLLETVGQYAQERLEERRTAPAVRARHADHYALIAGQAGPGLRVGGQSLWAPRTDRDRRNFAAAVAYALEGDDVDLALRIVAPLAVNGVGIGHAALDWADQIAALIVPREDDAAAVAAALMTADANGSGTVSATVTSATVETPPHAEAVPAASEPEPELDLDPELEEAEAATSADVEPPHPLMPRVLAWAAWGAVFHGEAERAKALIEAMDELQLLLDDEPHPSLHQPRATAALYGGRPLDAVEEARTWADDAEEADDEYELAQALTLLGSALCSAGEHEEGVPTLEQALRYARDIDNPAVALVALGEALGGSDPQQARELLAEAAERALAVGDRCTYANSLAVSAQMEARHGDVHAALRSSSHAVGEQLMLGDDPGVRRSLVSISKLLERAGRHEASVILVGATQSSVRLGGTDSWSAQSAPPSVGVLSDERIEELEAHGAALDRDAAVAYAREQIRHLLAST